MPCTLDAIHHFLEPGVLFGPAQGRQRRRRSGVRPGAEPERHSASRGTATRSIPASRRSCAQIHAQCVAYGGAENGNVNYVRGANIAGFVKVGQAMLAYGIV